MKPTRNLFVRLLSLSAITLLASHSAQAATSTWNTTTTAANWLTAGSWTGGVPGVNDIGLFNGTVNPGGGQVGFGASASFGAISLSGTASSITFGSISNAGTRAITLNGAIVDGVANTILSNKTSSPTTLSIISRISGNRDLAVTLGNTTNVIQISSGNTISIQVALAQANLLSGITLQGGGKLILSGANAYTGTTDVQAGTLELGANDVFANTSTIQISGGILDTTASNRTDTVSVFNMSSGSLNGGGTITATTYGLSGGTVNANLAAGTMNVTTGTVNLFGTSGSVAVNINSGTLSLGANDRLANGATVLVAGGILDTTASNRTDTVGAFNMSSGSLNGGGTITATTYGLSGGTVTGNLGAGTMTVTTGTVTLNGLSGSLLVNVNSGTLSLGADDRLANGATVLVAGGILDTTASNRTDTVSAFNMSSGSLNGGGTITAATYGLSGGTVTGNLGAGTMNVTTGTVTLNGLSGSLLVNVNSGTLSLGADDRLADTATVLVAGGILNTTASNRTDTVGAFNMSSGSLNGGGTITAATYGLSGGTVTGNLGAGTMNVTTGTVTLNGLSGSLLVNVNSGTLSLGADDRLADTATVLVAGGILNTTASNRTDTVGAFNMSSGSLNGGGTITAGTYGLSGGTVTANLGTGTLNVTGTVALNGTSAASAVNVSSGSLTLGSANNRFTNAPSVVVSGGALAVGNSNNTVGTVSLTGGASITGTGGTLTGSSYAVQSGSISAKLGGAGGLTKTTGGTVSLSAANTYTGATIIQAGTLELLTGGSLASLSIVVGDTGSVGAVLDAITTGLVVASGQTVSGSGAINGSTTIQSGGFLAPGNSIESLATGALSLNGGSTYAYELNKDAAATVAGDLTAVTGNLNISSNAVLTLTELGSGAWQLGNPLGDHFGLTPADKLTLISYTGIWNGGLFTYLGNVVPDDSAIILNGQQWWFNYNDTDPGTNFLGDLTGSSYVTMTVPEPGAALLGGIGLLFLLRRRRA